MPFLGTLNYVDFGILDNKYVEPDVTFLIRVSIKFQNYQICFNMATHKINNCIFVGKLSKTELSLLIFMIKPSGIKILICVPWSIITFTYKKLSLLQKVLSWKLMMLTHIKANLVILKLNGNPYQKSNIRWCIFIVSNPKIWNL